MLLGGAIIFGVAGALGGLLYRAPILVPATLLSVAFGATAGWLAGQSAAHIAVTTLVLIFALHLAYLAGLALRTLLGR